MVDTQFRLSYGECREVLAQRLAEPAPGRIQLLSGPRQVGKTSLLLELAERPSRFGAWVENAWLAHAWNTGQQLAYWREEPFEVDGVLEGPWGRWAVEVKTGPIATGDLRGLLEFTRRFPAYRPLLICDAAARPVGERLHVPVIAWEEFLRSGPPREGAGR